jgi:hypothetical protein
MADSYKQRLVWGRPVMLLEFPEPLHALAWAMLLALLGIAAWAKNTWRGKPWPKIEAKFERLIRNGFEVIDAAFRIWGWRHARAHTHDGDPDIEFSIYITLKRRKKKLQAG